MVNLADHALYLAKQAERNAWAGVFKGVAPGDVSEVTSSNLRKLAEEDRVRLSSRPLFDVRPDGLELVPGLAGDFGRSSGA
jgi:hypothetical protein